MAKIVLVVEKKHNLLSMFVENDGSSKNFVNKQSNDNKVIIKNYHDVFHAFSLFTGKDIRHIERGEYGTKMTSLDYFKLELPISECGKYILLNNPLADKQ